MKLLIILALVFLETCAGQMFGGKEAKEGQFPFAVQIRKLNCSGDCICGGAIVSPHWVITAAHCVRKDNKTFAVAVVAGDRWRFSTGEIPRVEIGPENLQAYPHPRYDDYTWNDVALIFVRVPFDRDPKVKMIGFGSEGGVKVGQKCTVMGRGYTETDWGTEESSVQSQVLKYGRLKITQIYNRAIRFGDLKRATGPYPLNGDSGCLCVNSGKLCVGLKISKTVMKKISQVIPRTNQLHLSSCHSARATHFLVNLCILEPLRLYQYD